MNKYRELKLGQSCSLSTFVFHTDGLLIDKTHLAVAVAMRQTDKYLILANIDEMLAEAKAKPQSLYNILTGHSFDGETLAMKLDDLRRWFIMEYCYDAMDNCDKVIELHLALAEKEKEMKELEVTHKKEMAEVVASKDALKEELDALKRNDDEWGSRVTYDNMVEQIAACEDTKERDEARKLIEPLLKRSTVTKFRRDIRNRAKELNGEGANITIQHVAGDFAVNKTVNQIGD